MRENYTIEPQFYTAATLAKALDWPEEKAVFLLETWHAAGYVAKGYHRRTGEEGYKLTGKGLVVGEKMGVVKEFDPLHGYGDAEGNTPGSH